MLDQLVQAARSAASARSESLSEARLEEMAREQEQRPGRSLHTALSAEGCQLIAELKRRSPSRGDIAPDVDAVECCALYERAGATAISVLTDSEHFGGCLADLQRVSAKAGIPVLRKDFLLDERGLLEARAFGADAALLIVRIIGKRLPTMLKSCQDLGLEALVEVHSHAEAQAALAAGAQIIGVNNRDLDTLTIDPRLVDSITPTLPDDVIVVSESGVREPDDVARLAALGVDAVLVGTALMQSHDPEATTRALAQAGLRVAR